MSPLDIALGANPMAITYHKFGRNPDVDTAAAEDIIEQGGLITFPAAEEMLEVVSSSNDDKTGGTGALTYAIEGVDAVGNWVNEKVALNGTTAVPFTQGLRRVFRGRVRSGTTPVGNITTRVAGGGATRLYSAAGNGGTLYCGVTIPLGVQGILYGLTLSLNRAGGTVVAYANIEVWVKPWASAAFILSDYDIVTGITEIHFEAPRIVGNGPVDIWVRAAEVSANDCRITAELNMVWLGSSQKHVAPLLEISNGVVVMDKR